MGDEGQRGTFIAYLLLSASISSSPSPLSLTMIGGSIGNVSITKDFSLAKARQN
jgi:hypothetical protein